MASSLQSARKNIIASTNLKEKAVQLRHKVPILTQVGWQANAVAQDRLAWKSMIAYELNEKQRKNPIFIARSRRFGNSLFIDTLGYYM